MNYIKYPRTLHLPWSQGATNDDKILNSTNHFDGRNVIVTEKMDGENTTMYSDYIHARSINTQHHESRSWIKNYHSIIKSKIPNGWRICGENVFAKHSVSYENLESFFYIFSLWDENNNSLSWSDVTLWADELKLPTPAVLYSGIWNETAIKNLNVDISIMEGYVVRISDSFHYDNFSTSLAKWVRKNHVQTDEHWMHSEIVQNKLKSD